MPHITACTAYVYIQLAWRQIRVTFISKPQKADYTEPKEYCPISLSSFVLKMIEELVHRHIRDGTLKRFPLP
jgi:hypothetical protein